MERKSAFLIPKEVVILRKAEYSVLEEEEVERNSETDVDSIICRWFQVSKNVNYPETKTNQIHCVLIWHLRTNFAQLRNPGIENWEMIECFEYIFH